VTRSVMIVAIVSQITADTPGNVTFAVAFDITGLQSSNADDDLVKWDVEASATPAMTFVSA